MTTAEAPQHKPDGRKTHVSSLTMLGRMAGALGAALLLTTPFTWILTGDLGVLVFLKLVIGLLLVAVYTATNADVFARLKGSRSTGLMAMTMLSGVIVLGLVGAVNFVAFKNQKSWDLTKEGLYTLSEQSAGVLARLQEPVQVYAFYASDDQSFAIVEETLGRYRAASDKLTYEMVSPQARPDLVKKYDISERGPRIVVTSRGQDARAKDTSEDELTNAIVKVAEQTQKKIYFLTGHGEADLDDGEAPEGLKRLADALSAEGYAVEKLSLIEGKEAEKGTKVELDGASAPKSGAKAAPAAKPAPAGKVDAHDDHAGHGHAEGDEEGLSIPAEVSVLVIAGPRSPLFAPEIEALEKYLVKGGRLIVMLEPDADGGLSGLLSQWKVAAQKDVVVDTNVLNRLMGLGPTAPMAQPSLAEQDHPIVKNLEQPVVFVVSRSLKTVSGGLPGVEASVLLESGESAWGETNVVGVAASFDDKDIEGPLPLAVLAKKPVGDPDKRSDEARLLVFGDTGFVSNKYVTSLQQNRDTFVNAVHWLAEEQARIAIRPKARAASQLFLTGEQMAQLKFFALDIMPVLIIALGLGIVLVRRQR